MRKLNLLFKYLCCIALFVCAMATRSYATFITVAKDGSGQYTTVQAAIDNAPIATSAANADTIYIKDGKYREKINVPSNKPFIVMIGQSVANTILTYDDGATTMVNGSPLGTQNSASVTINANDFTAMNITFANSYGDGTQAVAVLLNADRIAFRNCRFLGNQDTLYVKGAGTPRHYFRNCYIDGNVDFIFGSSIAVFDTCVIYGKVKPSITSTYMCAPNTATGQAYGLVFRGCQITGNTTPGYYYLGRPWQFNPKAVYLDSRIYNNMIIPAGWSSNSAGSATLSDAFFAEHKNRLGNGTLVDTLSRVTTSFQLNDVTAATYTLSNMLGTWDACAAVGCGAFTPTLAISNMKATKGATTSTIQWNISWPVAGVQYQLYRSSDNVTYAAVSGSVITAADDSTWNFQFTDNNPLQGSIYWYYVAASKTGYTTNNSDTVKISSAPTIVTTGALGAFNQFIGNPSLSQTYTVSGTNLTANVSITAPANFEIATGTTYSSTLSLAPTSGTLAATTIYVRQNATALGAYAGNIVHTSVGATTVNTAISGNTVPMPLVNSDTLEYWPLTVNNADSVDVRSAGVTPTTPTLNKLYLSTATSVATVPAYSLTYGQALGASATTDGAWGTAAGGPGGNLNRTFYEQFTIKAATGDSLRVDSLMLTAAFYLTSSNTKLAIAYSQTGFVSDSTDIIGATFLSPVTLANQSGGPTNLYRFAVTGGPIGVKTDTGGTLTFRFYFSCSSSSAGRYGMLKGVTLMGEVLPYVPCVPPTLSSTITNVSCAGNGSITVNTTGGSAPFTYAWTGPNSYASTNQNPTNLSAGIYHLTVTAKGGCTATLADTITASNFTTNITPLGATSFCQGDSVKLKAISGAGFTYVWSRNSIILIGATDSSYTAKDSGSYAVTVTTGNCSATSPVIIVTVNAKPVPTATAANATTFCAGDSVIINANAGTGLIYKWLNNGVAINGATNASLTAKAAGSYRVIETTSNNCTDTSTAITVAVNARPDTTISITGSLSFCMGDSVRLKAVNVTGNTYQWRKSGVAIGSATDSAYTIRISGNYSVKITNAAGCTDSSTIRTVTANPLPVPVITYSTGILSTGTTYSKYQWYLNGTVITGATNATYTPAVNGSYTVKVDSGSCSGTSAAYNVTGVGINNVVLNGQPVIVYPNPAHNVVYIQAATPINVQLKDMLGRILQSVSNATSLDISNLNNGVYFLTISTPDGAIVLTQRFVKTN